MKPKNAYAILVLGVSVKREFFKERVERAVKLYKSDKRVSQVIFSGKFWGGLARKPKQTEAALMARYARSLGLPQKATLTEKRSLNTIGNFYFTKIDILEPKKLTRLLVITQPSHIEKSRYIAHKVLGPKYRIRWQSDGSSIKPASKGHSGVSEIKKFFENVRAGDNDAIKKLLRAHPYYRRYHL
jgi:uncharacterized SAM-binding protein YcdF (DUF218 family)